MLQLKNIKKTYDVADQPVVALDGVSIDFRENEFVSILGPSGCGKTTLLNIVGGLDRYSDGDLLINGKSTEDFKDRDWDTYRNHSVGFVFQSYNLIPHQTVLANVELALTLSGVSKAERRRRATEALVKVGLGDQLKKKPNQMSGGQMQRVAIARAIVNDPDILLADEPTGALDTVTSVQIMEILKEIAKDKLVIMVTHNPELAEEYSTRIVKLRDGRVIDDSMPFEAPTSKEEVVRKTDVKKGKKTSMNFWTAFSLSMNNLLTKKGRTFMTSFAGSIGIIGIALILALSNGINAYIALVQEDTLSTYPLTIQKQTQDTSALLSAMTQTENNASEDHRDSQMIYVDDSMGTMIGALSATVENNLEAFKAYLEEHADEIAPYVSDIQYTYDYQLQVFNMVATVDEDGNPVTEAREISMNVIFDNLGEAFSGMSELMSMGSSMGSMGMDVFSEMINNQELLDQQYDVVAGNWPTAYNEVVLVIDSNNQLSKMTAYMLGILDPDNIEEEMAEVMSGKYEPDNLPPYTFEDVMGMSILLMTTEDFFVVDESKTPYPVDGKYYPVWKDIRENFDFDRNTYVAENGVELKISGIIRPKEDATATSISGAIGYTKELTDYILAENAASEVIAQQKETQNVNVLTGLPFERTHYTPETIGELIDKIDESTMEMFYGYITQQILSNPEFSDRVNVTDTESFLGMFMLLPADKQAVIVDSVISAAKANPANEQGLITLFTMLSYGTDGITVTADNFVRLLPALSTEIVLGALAGIPQSEQMPFAVPGLIEMAGTEAMSLIYTELSESIKTMTVNKDIFVALLGTLTAEDEAFIQLEETLYSMAPQIDATYESVLDTLDDAESAKPASINFYAVNFESKDFIETFIEDYNNSRTEESDKLKYTDVVGILMSGITTIINAISYVLIAFVSISLVVSSIMIGIITYISVLERTKEIGILRAMGASKRDVARVFNAETLIIGLCAGIIGVVLTVIICIPASIIVQNATGISTISAVLPWEGAIALVIVSVVMTVVAGLIPAKSASRKDPVIALRTE